MPRRRLVRTFAFAPLVALVGAAFGACDTNDGRQMREPDDNQRFQLENTDPTTTSTTTTIPPATTATTTTTTTSTTSSTTTTSTSSTSTTVASAASSSTIAASGSPATAASASVGVAPADNAGESLPGTTLPADTFPESLGLANLADADVRFSGPWTPGEAIAEEFTCHGENVAPPLSWTAPPAETVELALVARDESSDPPGFVHTIVIGLPPEAGSFGGDEALVVGAESMNSYGTIGWRGPCPPDPGVHTYRFTLYALDQAIELPPEAVPGDMLNAIEASATGAVSFTGTYQAG